MTSIYSAGIFFLVYLVTILITLRFIKFISPTGQVCGLALITYFLGLVIINMLEISISFYLFSSLYWFLALTLLMIFGAVYKSISLKMMLNLLHKPNKHEFYELILKNDIENQSFAERVKILLHKSWIENSSKNTFVLTKKGVALAHKLWILQKLFSIKESG